MADDTFVIADGPYPRQNFDGDEVPYWVVFVSDDSGEPIGKVYQCASRDKAIDLGEKMSKDRGLHFENETSYA